MDKNNTRIQIPGGMKNVDTKSKSLTPAVLGVANSHGVKFPTNMTSEYKKELFSKLEEWRKARKEKLAASILAKQKQISVPSVPPKNKLLSTGEGGNLKTQTHCQDRMTVFERLYKNGKRKSEVPVNSTKQQQLPKPNLIKTAASTLETSSEPVIVSPPEKEFETSALVTDSDGTNKKDREIGAKNFHNDSVLVSLKTEEERNEFLFNVKMEEKSNEGVNIGNSDHVKAADLKAVKTDSGLINLPKKLTVEKHKKPLRRSLSMMFHQRSRTGGAVRKCISARNLNEINLNLQKADFENLERNDHNQEKENKSKTVLKPVTIETPRNTKSVTSSAHLRTKLEDWLKLKGHSLEGYKHLRCFGINNEKTFLEAPPIPSDDFLEKSCYAVSPKTPTVDLEKENVSPPTVIGQVDVKDADNWLKELYRLIVELKYPSERCEDWLAAIKKRCSDCSQLPTYWECLAALHESKGDLKSAIEDYERAIIKGGEVDVVGDSLAQLFDKMVIEQKKHSKPKLEKGLDPKNIFKSTIIKFALQQKTIKKLSSEIEPGVREQLYVATPVRRSSRIQTPMKSADEVASLRALTPELRKNVAFKPNQSLLE